MLRRVGWISSLAFASAGLLAWAADPPSAAERARIEATLRRPPASQPVAARSTVKSKAAKSRVAAQNVPAAAPAPWTLDDAARSRPAPYYAAPPSGDAGADATDDVGPPAADPREPATGPAPMVVPVPVPVPVAAVPPAVALPRRVFNAIDMDFRARRLLDNADRAIQAGLRDLKQGDYEAAALSFRLAADLDQADPVARVHFAHAALGTGEYEAGGAMLRRALELQDKLILMRFDHERYFKDEPDFNRLVDRLATLMQDEGGVGDEHFLLGYFQQQRGKRDDAAASFLAAKRAGISDDSLAKLLDLTATKRR